MSGSALKTIPLTWPFSIWGMAGYGGKIQDRPQRLHAPPRRHRQIHKWMEVKPIKKCDGKMATKFLRNIIYRYRYPHNIITDNGTNFAKGEMAEFCNDNGIRLDLTSVAHPEANGVNTRIFKSRRLFSHTSQS
jgi:hypothetical protein